MRHKGNTVVLLNLTWIDAKKKLPPKSIDYCDRGYVISDGEKIGIAIWTNVPDFFEFEVDDYHFQANYGGYVAPLFWMGPIENTQPAHLNPRYINKVVRSDTDEEPPSPSTYEKLIKLGLSEILSEKVCTSNKNLSTDEVKSILSVRQHLPCSYMPTFYEVVVPLAMNTLEKNNG